MKITIKLSALDVAPFVSEVQRNADLNKDALGFLPATVYDDEAKQGNLYVAVAEKHGTDFYAGHLLFGGVFPQARIVQLFVAPEFRSQGVGRKLLDALVELTEKLSYLHICAGVATDLPANSFYEKMGFQISRTRPGSLTRKRVINVRVKQLNTPDLFKLAAYDAEGLLLVDRLANRPAVYVIDLNVFWDVVRQRPRSQYAADIVSAALHHLVHVVVTSEFLRELYRSSRSTSSDPALEFALQLPSLGEPEPSILESLVHEITPLIFPSKIASGAMSAQDRSDLVHLGIAIHHGANAFVTGEKAILLGSSAIYSRYGVEVIHVEQFSASLRATQKPIPAFRAQLSSDTFDVRSLVANHRATVEIFLDATGAAADFRNDFLATGVTLSSRKRIAVTSNAEIVCIASWDTNAGLLGRALVRLIANEEHAAVQTGLDCIISQICKEASRAGPTLLQLSTPPGQTESRKVALLHGFQPTEVRGYGGEQSLQKLCIGRPITLKNWTRIRNALEQCSGLSFHPGFSRIGVEDVQISFTTSDGSKRAMPLSRLEKMLSPTLFALPDRAGCIVPIRRGYAELLLDGAPQLSLTPKREASLFSNRVYFSAARNAHILVPGTPLLFYESGRDGGRACVTAVSRVLTTEIHAKSEVSIQSLRHGVVDATKLENLTSNESIAVTSFDNVIILDSPIPLKRLREMGCVDGSNFITVKRITHEQLVSILEEGCFLG